MGLENLRGRLPLKKRKILKRSVPAILKRALLTALLASGTNWLIAYLNYPGGGKPGMLAAAYGPFLVRLILTCGFLSILWVPFYNILYFYRYFYAVDDLSVIIRKGVIARREANVPFKQVQSISVDQDVLDVLFGLYDVHFHAGQKSRLEHIDGLDGISAAALRTLVLQKIKQAL